MNEIIRTPLYEIDNKKTISNHIDCPICKRRFCETDCYHKIEYKEIIMCKNCSSEFEFIEHTNYGYSKFKLIKTGFKNAKQN